MRRRRAPALAVLLLATILVALAFLNRHALWRSAYPHLPRQVQALPYRLAARLPGARATPVGLPTVAGIAPASIPPDLAGTATAVSVFLGTVVLPRPTGTLTPEATAPSPAPPPAPTAALPPSAAIGGFRHEYQTWNNCGPATASMALSALGAAGDQSEAASFLKPDPDDKNVGPEELAAYARQRGYGASVRVNGTIERLKALLVAGFPVIVETWFIPDPGDEMGHYRLLSGYDDAAGEFTALDSYHGPNVRLPYAEFDGLWRIFNRTYVVVYPSDREEAVQAQLGLDGDDGAMFAAAAARARAELAARPDAFGWFNLGSSLVGLGDMPAAAEAFDEARALGLPWRMLWYQFGPFEAYAAVGRWPEVAALAEANLANADNLEESHYWLGRARAQAGDVDGARAAWQRALALNPNAAFVRDALEALP
jgi:tetratricopeptide (TPR) repeat protein